MSHLRHFVSIRRIAVAALLLAVAGCAEVQQHAPAAVQATPDVSVGAQYDTTHVYVDDASHYDALVNAWTATFGGHTSPRITANIMPVPANTQFQYVWSPVGNLSTFSFLTPVPFPFGQERVGWLVTDIDKAIAAARAAGAEILVDKFKDPIGYDVVVQFPGGVKFQLYWHFTAPNYDALTTVPDTRVYVTADSIDAFVRDFLKFSHGKILSDVANADAAEIGKPGQTYRRVRIESGFGKLQTMVTDGHLPYPFGREITGYEVKNLDETLAKAQAHGAKVLSPRFDGSDRSSAILEFPGGYIVEVHAAKR